MLRIGQVEATATQDGKYTDGSVAGGIAATRLRAAAFNAMQEELAHIVESAGLALDINDMTQVLKAIQKLTLSRANPFADIKSDGAAAISTALTNLGLGEAATRNVGTDTGQVPDMSSFTTGHSGAADWPIPKSGWSKGPEGVITQWGIFGFPVGQTGTNVVFPLPFPARVESITLTMADIQESLLSPTTMPAYGVNSTGTSRTGFTARMSGVGGFNLCYIAKGR
ncbi:hypothetical protein D5Z35_08690 [Escherichia coli]|uniref:gp53-like domain-containing protein n=1 Tax=Escherichia coli TaxID=562 RepID=UPI0007752D87|nr:hypothetical protein [Escherichia coli]EEZ8969536.1 hypothetical protein [Escherichia coli]EFN9138113.1 hypothetical protein [Escherichia coli]ELO5054116.1 hypothetical protein [Escherichia coli]KXP45395.1 hypothetical protein AUQ30_13940 [Escherichia coli]MDT9838084.1 hypothetical protein [Escherichia coli]